MEYLDKINNLISMQYFTSILIGVLIVYLFYIICFANIFKKLGIPTWKAFIPIYDLYIYLSIVSVNFIWYILLVLFLGLSIVHQIFLLPTVIVLILFHVLTMSKLAKVFEKGLFFTLGLILIHPIFMIIISVDKSKNTKKGKFIKFVSNNSTEISNQNEIQGSSNEIICPNCGSRISITTKYCVRCGYKAN